MTRAEVWMALSVLCVLSLCSLAKANPGLQPARADRVIWSDKPAADWKQEAYPLGNGSFGAMLFGSVANERVQFNADTLWIGDENYNGFYQAFGDLFIEQPAILSGKGAVCRLKTSGPVTVTHKENALNVTKHDDGSISFPSESGESYRIVPR